MDFYNRIFKGSGIVNKAAEDFFPAWSNEMSSVLKYKADNKCIVHAKLQMLFSSSQGNRRKENVLLRLQWLGNLAS